MAGLATYIGYQAADAPDYTKLQEAFQANQAKRAAQEQKQQLQADKTFYAATEAVRDFTSGTSPQYTDFVQQGVADVRNALFFENTQSGKSATDLKRFNNNALNGFQSFATFGKNFDTNLKTFQDRAINLDSKTQKPQASPLETGFFSKLYASQGLTQDAEGNLNKLITGPDGNLYLGKFDVKGNIVDYTPTQVNTLNNIANYQQNFVSVNQFTDKYEDNLGVFKDFYKTITQDGADKNVTLAGLAVSYNQTSTSGKKFKEAYDEIVEGSFNAITASPNVAAAALVGESQPSSGNSWFYYIPGIKKGEFAIGNRDPEDGIAMVQNSTQQYEAKLTDGQLDLLRNDIKSEINGQIGLSRSATYSRAFTKGRTEREQREIDLKLALRLRAGQKDAWDEILGFYNNNAATKENDKIISYQVTPERIILKPLKGDAIIVNQGEFTGQNANMIKGDLAELMLYIDPKAYDNRTKAMSAVEGGIESLGLDLNPLLQSGDYDFEGARQSYLRLSDIQRRGITDKLTYTPRTSTGTQGATQNDFFPRIGNLVDELQSVINYDPVAAGTTGRKSDTGGGIIEQMKVYQMDPKTGNVAREQTFMGTQVGSSADFTASIDDQFKTDFINALDTQATKGNPVGRNFVEIVVRGGEDGKQLDTFKFRPISRGQRSVSDTQVADENATEYLRMLNHASETKRTGEQFYPQGTSVNVDKRFSSSYKDGVL